MLQSSHLSFIHSVPPQQWSQVRVVEVAPVTDLLSPVVKQKIRALYSTLISCCPPNLIKPIDDNQYFDGGAHGLRTISSLDIRSGVYLDALCTIYQDGTRSDGWSEKGGKKHVFELNSGTLIEFPTLDLI